MVIKAMTPELRVVLVPDRMRISVISDAAHRMSRC